MYVPLRLQLSEWWHIHADFHPELAAMLSFRCVPELVDWHQTGRETPPLMCDPSKKQCAVQLDQAATL